MSCEIPDNYHPDDGFIRLECEDTWNFIYAGQEGFFNSIIVMYLQSGSFN